MNPNASLLDRAGLDKVRVGKLIDRGLEGADDGELFLEYKQSEMLVFDNGRLKQATYDTTQGFGLRAVKDEAAGYAHASDVSEAAISRAADAVRAVKGGYSGNYAAAPARSSHRSWPTRRRKRDSTSPARRESPQARLRARCGARCGHAGRSAPDRFRDRCAPRAS